jgi:hypothetical protein
MEPLRGFILIDFSTSLEMTGVVLQECLMNRYGIAR